MHLRRVSTAFKAVRSSMWRRFGFPNDAGLRIVQSSSVRACQIHFNASVIRSDFPE
jgi:hypothetical protein